MIQNPTGPWQHKGWQLGEAFPLKVLSCSIRDPTFLPDVFDCIDPTYFSKDDLGLIARLIREYFQTSHKPPTKEDLAILIYERCKSVDPDGSLGWAQALLSRVDQIYDTDVSDVELVRERVRDFGRLQAIAKAVQKSLSFLEETDPNKKADDTLQKIQSTFNDAFQVGTNRSPGVHFNKIALEVPAILRNSENSGQEYRVPTGIPIVDKILRGGPGAGTMNLIMAPPNRGKSTVMACLGVQAALHFHRQSLTSGVRKAVIHITCEMTEEDLMAKYSSGCSGISMDDLESSRSYPQVMEQRIQAISDIYIRFFPMGTATTQDIYWYISNLMMKNVVPGLLILDYADLLRGYEDDRFQGMGNIYKELIAMGHKFKFPIWNATQITREEAKKIRHSVTGAAESWKKIEISDNVIILNQSEEEMKQGLMALGLGKLRRNSKSAGIVNCRIDYGRVALQQLEGDIQQGSDASSIAQKSMSESKKVSQVQLPAVVVDPAILAMFSDTNAQQPSEQPPCSGANEAPGSTS